MRVKQGHGWLDYMSKLAFMDVVLDTPSILFPQYGNVELHTYCTRLGSFAICQPMDEFMCKRVVAW